MQKLLIIGALLIGLNPLLAQNAAETPAQHDTRMAWWREARFGLVIHWMDVNGEAIYGTGPTLFGAEAGRFSETEKDKEGQPKFIPAWEWRCTTKAGKVYSHVFNWPADELKLPVIKSKVTKAYLLADRSANLVVRQSDAGVNVALPRRAPDAIASVLCLEVQ